MLELGRQREREREVDTIFSASQAVVQKKSNLPFDIALALATNDTETTPTLLTVRPSKTQRELLYRHTHGHANKHTRGWKIRHTFLLYNTIDVCGWLLLLGGDEGGAPLMLRWIFHFTLQTNSN